MTKEQRAQLDEARRQHEVWHIKQERKWRPKIYKALKINADSFTTYAKTNGITAAVGVIDTLIEMKPIADVLRSLYLSVGTAKALSVKRYLEKDVRKANGDFIGVMNDILTQFFFTYGMALSVASILATQRKRMLQHIASQLQPGVPEESIVQAVQNDPNYVQNLVQQAAQRAAIPREQVILSQLIVPAASRGVDVIARTEITRVLNYSAYQAAKNLDFYVDKVWLSLHDDKTRRPHKNSQWDHWSPLGQTVAVELPFIVSGEKLMYPGDPSASGGNVVGCRCGQMFFAKRDTKGNIIYKPRNITVIRPAPSNVTRVVTI